MIGRFPYSVTGTKICYLGGTVDTYEIKPWANGGAGGVVPDNTVYDWMAQNLAGDCAVTSIIGGECGLCFAFVLEADALLFQLRFGGRRGDGLRGAA